MSNALSKITAAILAVVLLYLVPAVQSAQREEDYRALMAYNTLVRFTDAVRNKGYLSRGMYNDFVNELATAGGEYMIDMEYRHKKYHPEYSDPADSSTFLDRFSVHYEAYYSQDILSILFPDEPALDKKEEPMYRMEAGDYFTVTITHLSRTPITVLYDFLYGETRTSSSEVLNYGGMVLNEDY
ncbi:hypothetical protein [Paenibacillus lentus]|uniref:Uncharacterized protein n=1 Tax=Paenibacillus lentus TaxID=1338368 RepID=A0A3Q8S5F7_9BACL|nr:hypothetical protein [Paenibacillus lentus]AZK47386.1 hypothetical protein EIM92_15515 [Paenibacillus lentus]